MMMLIATVVFGALLIPDTQSTPIQWKPVNQVMKAMTADEELSIFLRHPELQGRLESHPSPGTLTTATETYPSLEMLTTVTETFQNLERRISNTTMKDENVKKEVTDRRQMEPERIQTLANAAIDVLLTMVQPVFGKHKTVFAKLVRPILTYMVSRMFSGGQGLLKNMISDDENQDAYREEPYSAYPVYIPGYGSFILLSDVGPSELFNATSVMQNESNTKPDSDTSKPETGDSDSISEERGYSGYGDLRMARKYYRNSHKYDYRESNKHRRNKYSSSEENDSREQDSEENYENSRDKEIRSRKKYKYNRERHRSDDEEDSQENFKDCRNNKKRNRNKHKHKESIEKDKSSEEQDSIEKYEDIRRKDKRDRYKSKRDKYEDSRETNKDNKKKEKNKESGEIKENDNEEKDNVSSEKDKENKDNGVTEKNNEDIEKDNGNVDKSEKEPETNEASASMKIEYIQKYNPLYLGQTHLIPIIRNPHVFESQKGLEEANWNGETDNIIRESIKQIVGSGARVKSMKKRIMLRILEKLHNAVLQY